jgi:WD40 repeat protein
MGSFACVLVFAVLVGAGSLDDPATDEQIVFREQAGLYITKPDATVAQLIFASPSGVVPAHRLSPDRRLLLLQRETGVQEKDTRPRVWFLSVLDLQSRNAIDIERHTRGHCWSHDGRRIFYARPVGDATTEVLSVARDGTDAKTHCLLPGTAYVEDAAPDGQSLLVTIESDRVVALGLVREKEKDIYRVSLDGDRVNVSNDPALDKRPRYSPDGRHILFTSTRAGTSQLYVMDASGNNLKQLTTFPVEPNRLTGAIYGCTWSPDGKRIAYSWVWFPPHDADPVMYVANADGTGAVVLRNNAQEPDWR